MGFRFHVALPNSRATTRNLLNPNGAGLGWASAGHRDCDFHFERHPHLNLGAHLWRESLHNESVDLEHNAVTQDVFPRNKEERLGGALRGLRAAQRALRCHPDAGLAVPDQIWTGRTVVE